MFMKYILFFCLTYFIPKVNSMDEVVMEILWDAIRCESDFINQGYWCRYYKDEDPTEFLSVLQTYGHQSAENENNVEYRMYYKDFKKAASDGHIHFYSEQAIKSVFEAIIANKQNKLTSNITHKDLSHYYGPIILPLQLGKHLGFNEFKKAVNNGDLPKPWRDEVAIEAEIVYLFNKMKNIQEDYVNRAFMSNYYGDYNDYKPIVKTYGSIHIVKDEILGEYDEYRMTIEEFKKAGSEGDIPRFSRKLIHAEFMKIIGKKEDKKYITFKELNRYYKKIIPETHLKYVIGKYGETQDDQYRMTFDNFSRAINGGYLTDLFHNKMTAMYNLFKEILPKYGGRNYIMLDDMVKHYGIKKPTDLENFGRILQKYGQFRSPTLAESGQMKYFDYKWNGGQYLLNFLNFKRSMNFGDLSLPE
ncbi:uncharacterized protein LOC126844594 isoform X2 [Adelges cooleyi]|uniref:uncharacterized protein LOC126844594 isoform X2 n=1 Tax=Adelges cooleyi TaxID=133065 RepID=UPI002180361B|nr:uncharacterized protein LOC126844594 isoform X2 [Adelges cooleyi]